MIFSAPVAAKVSGYDIVNFVSFLPGVCITQGDRRGHFSVSYTILSMLIFPPKLEQTL